MTDILAHQRGGGQEANIPLNACHVGAGEWQSWASSMVLGCWLAAELVKEKSFLRALRVSLANFLFPCVSGVGQSVTAEKHQEVKGQQLLGYCEKDSWDNGQNARTGSSPKVLGKMRSPTEKGEKVIQVTKVSAQKVHFTPPELTRLQTWQSVLGERSKEGRAPVVSPPWEGGHSQL